MSLIVSLVLFRLNYGNATLADIMDLLTDRLRGPCSTVRHYLKGCEDRARAYPSLHPFGVVHWVPVLSNIKTATGCESNRQLQL